MSLYGRDDIPVLWSCPTPSCCGHFRQSFSDWPYQICPGYQFSPESETLKFYGGGGGGWQQSVMSSGMTKNMNQTMYLLLLLFWERLGHIVTIASVCTTKCASDGSISSSKDQQKGKRNHAFPPKASNDQSLNVLLNIDLDKPRRCWQNRSICKEVTKY